MDLQQASKQCYEDTEKWFPHVNNLGFMALALCGEAGELANLVKKVERGSTDMEEAEGDMVEEVTDVFTYLLNIAHLLGMNLEEEFNRKRSINEKRFRR